MIINSVSAENVLKYARLELEDLPERGIIAVSGQNESGKSSIGETICFALYGRTFSLGPDDLDKVIRWGEVECSARLTFTVSDGKKYEVARFLDTDGNHSARISPADDLDHPVARGNEAVRIKLYELTGYDYEHFTDSFYLAQREITTPHAHSYTVKTMAGIAPLERCTQVFEDEMETEETSIVETEAQAEEFKQDLDELKIDEALMPTLQGDFDANSKKMEARTTQVETLSSSASVYQESLPQYLAAKGKRATAGRLRGLMFLLMAAAGGAWALLKQWPESSAAESLRLTLSGIPQWDESKVPFLLYAAIAFAVLFIIFWMRRSSKSTDMDQHEKTALGLATELEQMPAEDWESEEEITQRIAESDTPADVIERPSREKIQTLRRNAAALIATPTEVKDGLSGEFAWRHNEISGLKEKASHLEESISVEQTRLDEGARLQEICTDLDEKRNDQQRRVAARQIACELLVGASTYISKRFNQELRGLVGATLPLLTEDRYEHLKIDEDLSVQAFSTEKRDFMELDEISSGTQRQIMLSVRLALAQELINRTVKGDQFLFLDEPFAFFDENRTRKALAVLPTLSDDLAQNWIIAQSFPDDMKFDRHIECSREFECIPNELEA